MTTLEGALNRPNTPINYLEDFAPWIGPTPSHDRKAGEVSTKEKSDTAADNDIERVWFCWSRTRSNGPNSVAGRRSGFLLHHSNPLSSRHLHMLGLSDPLIEASCLPWTSFPPNFSLARRSAKPVATSDGLGQLHAVVATTPSLLQAFSPNIVTTANGSLAVGAAKIALGGPPSTSERGSKGTSCLYVPWRSKMEFPSINSASNGYSNPVSSSSEKQVMTREPSSRYPSSHPTLLMAVVGAPAWPGKLKRGEIIMDSMGSEE